MKLFVLFILAGCVFCGCSVKYSNVPTKLEHKNNFMVGESQSKSVGEPMITQDDVILYPAFTTEKELTFPDAAHWSITSVPAGAILRAKYQYEDGKLFCMPASDFVILLKGAIMPNVPICLVIEPLGGVTGLATCRSPQGPVDVDEFKGLNFQKTTIYGPGSMRKEIVYNGKSKDTIKMLYREYKDDMARPAFFQDLSYDLLESKIIGFRGTLIEILEATNSSITYKVIKKNLF